MALENPAMKMCATKRCPNVGTGQPRSRRHCGPCYREVVLADVELVRCEVIGPYPVVDARTGEDVMPGGEVWLDPGDETVNATNIPALIAGGHVRIVPAEQAEQPAETPAAEGKKKA